MGNQSVKAENQSLFIGENQICQWMRSHDWSQTPIGASETWPQSLHLALGILLHAPYPLAIAWGTDGIGFYNDALASALGRNPIEWLGHPLREGWPELWREIGSDVETVLASGLSVCRPHQPWHGHCLSGTAEACSHTICTQEHYLSWSHSPIVDDQGQVSGVLITACDTTTQVVGDRRLETLRDLADAVARAQSLTDASELALGAIATTPLDVPFALLYRADVRANQAHLVESVGLAQNSVLTPARIDLTIDITNEQSDGLPEAALPIWPLAIAAQTGQPQITPGLASCLQVAMGYSMATLPDQALTLPLLHRAGSRLPVGWLVVGLPAHPVDPEAHRGFLTLVAEQMTLAIARWVEVPPSIPASAAVEPQANLAEASVSRALATSTDAVVAFDRDGRCTNVNLAAARLLRRSATDLIGCPWSEVFPDWSLHSTALGSQLEQAMREQVTLPIDAFSQVSERWLDGSIIPSGEGVLVCLRELHERQSEETEHRPIAEIWHQTNQMLRTLVESSPLPLMVVEFDLTVRLWNAAATNVFGWTEAEVLNHPLPITPSDQLTSCKALREAIARGEQFVNVETERLRKDGSRVLVSLSAAPLYNDKQEFSQILLIYQDITARKQHEQAFRDSQERLVLAQQIGHIGTCEFNFQTRRLIWTPEMDRLYGLPPGGFTGHYHEWLERVYPGDRPWIDTLARRALAGESDFDTEFRIVHPDGSLRWMGARAKIFKDEHGIPLRLIGVNIDITARKQAEATLQTREAELRLIADSVPALIAYVDADRRYRFVNRAYTDWFGEAAEDLIGRRVEEFVGEAVYPYMRHQVDAVLAGEAMTVELWMPFQGIGPRYVRRQYLPDISETGEVRGFYALITDLTDRKQVEAALQASEERLRFALEGAELGSWNYDLVTGELVWSERCKAMFGLAPDCVMTYETFIQVVHPGDRDLVNEAVRQAIAHHSEYDVEMRSLWPDGSLHWIRSTGRVYCNPPGVPVQMAGVAQDITQRKQAEQALQESEERYRSLVAATASVVWDTDASGQFVKPQLSWEAYTGQCWEMHRGWGWLEEMHPADRDRVRHLWQTAVDLKSLYQAEGRLWHAASGEYRHFMARGIPLFHADGSVREWIGILLDVHDRKQAEQALQEREQRFSTLFNGMEDWVLVYHLTPDHRPGPLIEVNEQACRRLGYTRDELLTMSVEALLGPAAIAPRPYIARLLQEQHLVLESVHQTKSGQLIPVEVSATLFTLNGLPTVQAICRDVTERRRAEEALRASEERFRLAVRAVAGIVYDWDLTSDQVYRSDGLYQLVGVKPDEALPTRQWWTDRIHPDDLARIEADTDTLLSEGDRYDHEYRVRHQDGHWVNVWDRGYLIRDRNGLVVRVVGSTADITERKRAEAEREQLLAREQAAREQAEAANRIKDEFLAVLSHELRSPLNPILGWTKLLQSRRLDEQVTQRALETIERNVKLQTQLIEDLLDVSRILRGKMVLTIGRVDLVIVIQAAIDTVRLAAEAKGISLQTHLDASARWVSGDAARLQQVVWNLLSNAVKFTPPGGRVDIRLEAVSWPGLEEGEDRKHGGENPTPSLSSSASPTSPPFPTSSYAQITVTDTGKGIRPDFLPHVFEHFRQEDGRTTRQFGGLGLGLAIVHYLIDLHGGTVDAFSEGENQGATFTVRLPLSHRDPADPDPASSQGFHDGYTPLLKGLTILVVDDEADVRDLMQTVLCQAGARVRLASSVADGLALLDQSSVDVVVSDIGMPEVDGYTFMRQVRGRRGDRRAHIPAIALTAYAGEGNQQQALDAGFQRHLAKPIEPHALIEAIATLVRPSGDQP